LIEVTLQLDAGSRTPAGRLTAARGATQLFEGWLELYALLGETLAGGSPESKSSDLS
jgi:hypothetical protein